MAPLMEAPRPYLGPATLRNLDSLSAKEANSNSSNSSKLYVLTDELEAVCVIDAYTFVELEAFYVVEFDAAHYALAKTFSLILELRSRRGSPRSPCHLLRPAR